MLSTQNSEILCENKIEELNVQQKNDSEYLNNVKEKNIISDKSYSNPLTINIECNESQSTPSSSPTRVTIDDAPIRRIHRVVLTGGPCAGKTTSINSIRSFFENIGWKVLCVPETATLLLSSGISFYDLEKHTITFQENLLKTLIQIEDTINETAKFYNTDKNLKCLIIYDRGAMDPIAYLSKEDWETLKEKNPKWNEVELRDNRYDQIIHLITAANGAESFYSLENNLTRTESIELAREIDEKLGKAWLGHPYMDVIDNCTEFDKKIARVLQSVCERIGLNFKGFDASNRKRKFLVDSLPDTSLFPNYQDFNVIHNYLLSNSINSQARIRKRGQSNNWVYTYTVRIRDDGQTIETKKQIDQREYAMLLKTIDSNHLPVYKLRRCFVWKRRYFQLDIYEEPCKPNCRGLLLLETYINDDEKLTLPNFLQIEKEVTDDSNYSMFNLSLKK